jgi:hypothetical protein
LADIWIKTPDNILIRRKQQVLVPGENRSVILQPGDGMVYKGCERPHWRDPMPGPEAKARNLFGKTQEHQNLLSSDLFSLCACKTVKEHTVHGIEHDEGTTF